MPTLHEKNRKTESSQEYANTRDYFHYSTLHSRFLRDTARTLITGEGTSNFLPGSNGDRMFVDIFDWELQDAGRDDEFGEWGRRIAIWCNK